MAVRALLAPSEQETMMQRHVGVWAFTLFTVLGCAATTETDSRIRAVSQAATVPTGFADESFVTNLSFPTAMAFAPDGRLFVCIQDGELRVVKNGSLLPTPALSLTVESSGERGLLGVAFDPSFATNQRIYLYYTATSPAIHNRVSRFTMSGDVTSPSTEVALLDLPNLGATNHNGGAIHFGNDGKLYVAVGENAVSSNSQSLNTPLGKMLRINSDGTIPSDNPFLASTTGTSRAIWALGLRNPYTFDVRRTTGRIFINDVGEGIWEEIDDGIAGSNYGWPMTEGPTTDPNFRSPIFAYTHAETGGCAIVGGTFYDPPTPRFPASFIGDYFFADLCAGFIRSFDPASGQVTGFATGIVNPVDLKVGPDGALYYLFRGSGGIGGIGRIRSTTPVPAVGFWGTMLLGAALAWIGARVRRSQSVSFARMK
jgi:glucose/arabinose dehydrogenase